MYCTVCVNRVEVVVPGLRTSDALLFFIFATHIRSIGRNEDQPITTRGRDVKFTTHHTVIPKRGEGIPDLLTLREETEKVVWNVKRGHS